MVDLLVDPLGPGIKPQEEMNVEYIEKVAVDVARSVSFGFGAYCDVMSFFRSLASGSMSLPSREYTWTNLKGIKYNLTNNQAYVRNYVLGQARKMVMKQTNGLYPAPLKILQVSLENPYAVLGH